MPPPIGQWSHHQHNSGLDLQTEIKLKQSKSQLKQDAALMAAYLFTQSTLICCTYNRSGYTKMPN